MIKKPHVTIHINFSFSLKRKVLKTGFYVFAKDTNFVCNTFINKKKPSICLNSIKCK